MTATIRKQIQRAHLKHNGGKRLDLYLTKEECQTLEAFKVRGRHSSLTDAVKALIEPHMTKPGEPAF